MAATLNQEVHTTCRRRRVKTYYQDYSGSLRILIVVYFDQRLGAAYSKRWSKYAVINSCLKLKRGNKVMKIDANLSNKMDF